MSQPDLKERPILFSAAMVRAILEGRKTQTRRVIKGNPVNMTRFIGRDDLPTWEFGFHDTHERVISKHIKCPQGQPGDLLWVRETWQAYRQTSYEYNEWEALEKIRDRYDDFYTPVYKADNKNFPDKWFPSIFMPREFSRIDLLIKDIRVERLQDISEADALAEGIDFQWDGRVPEFNEVSEFRELWDSINAKKHPWNSNPWVWVINFERIKP